MDFMVNIELKKLPKPITYHDKLLLTGSCFTEHIGNALMEGKFSVLQNPNGILFDPASVCKSLVSYIENTQYRETDLFQLNDVWHSWQHHSRFSNTNPKTAIEIINASQQNAHTFLKQANWLIVTLGSSFSYRLIKQTESSKTALEGSGVANCHRAPGQWFIKHLLEITETVSMLEDCYRQLIRFNGNLHIIFTVSPVRHIRDGVIDNNRSKARLIEAVHHMANKFQNVYYFPAYELVIDVLRDYRFYDIDLAHPNYTATEFVLEKFSDACIDEFSKQLMRDVKKIVIARKHRAFQPETKAHQEFLRSNFEKAKMLQEEYPFLDLKDEIAYFSRV
jgi:hypothetical protein